MQRSTLNAEIRDRIGDRRLVWFGTRGEDAEAACDLPQFDAAFSLIAPLTNRASVEGFALEDLSGARIDLDTYDIDAHLRTAEVAELRGKLLGALSRPSVLFTYRPTTFLSAVSFARRQRCEYLGMFHGHQSAFEHKPWLETSVAELGLPHIPWRYVPDIEQLDTSGLLEEGPVMLRRSRTTGGVGFAKVDSLEQLGRMWPIEDEAYVSVAPYYEGAVSLNVGAVVWRDGVTMHPASVQLIGIDGATHRRFGYCGNDFGAVRELDPPVLDAVENGVRKIGNWLRSAGYLGAFGVDFLVVDGVPLFTEVNPRFQGSTHASCRLAVEQGESCILTEHIAAFLGIPAPPSKSLRWWTGAPDLAHLVVHHDGPSASLDPMALVAGAQAVPTFGKADVLTRKELVTFRGGTIARLTFRDQISTSGHVLRYTWRALVDAFIGKGISAASSA